MEWLPIDSAPKNEAEVILWLPEIEGEQRQRWIKSRWIPWGNCWSNEESNGPAFNVNYYAADIGMKSKLTFVKPSHWMPDFLPPKDEP